MVQIENSVQAGCHVEVVLAAVLPQIFASQPELLEPPANLLRAVHNPQLHRDKNAITIAIGIGLYWCIACQNRELEVRETPLLYCLNPCKDVISLNNERVLPEGHQIKITIKQLSKQSQSVKVGKSYALNGT